jgi:hypothetical protein
MDVCYKVTPGDERRKHETAIMNQTRVCVGRIFSSTRMTAQDTFETRYPNDGDHNMVIRPWPSGCCL